MGIRESRNNMLTMSVIVGTNSVMHSFRSQVGNGSSSHDFAGDNCVLYTFAPLIIILIYVSGNDLNSNASLNLDASLLYGCTWNSKIACTINKKSAKLLAIHNIPPPTHML